MLGYLMVPRYSPAVLIPAAQPARGHRGPVKSAFIVCSWFLIAVNVVMVHSNLFSTISRLFMSGLPYSLICRHLLFLPLQYCSVQIPEDVSGNYFLTVLYA